MRTLTLCNKCNKEVEYITKNQLENIESNDSKKQYLHTSAYCIECASELYVEDIHDMNIKRYKEALPNSVVKG